MLTSYSYDQFREIASITDFESPYTTAGTTYSKISTRSTAKRLRRTRQQLGTYRHDLVVAMRVVNNVEQEMLRAEWENWLLDENLRCKQVEVILREDHTPGSSTGKGKVSKTQKPLSSLEKARSETIGELREWQEEYCGSCKREQTKLVEGRSHLTFG